MPMITAAIVGPGNIGTEVLATVFDRLGVRTGVDKDVLLSAAEEVVKPHITRLPVMDRSSIVQGYAGVYPSFLLHAERAAARYGVASHEILYRIGAKRCVGGQQDMTIDIALELLREQAAGELAMEAR
ncbi:hypothetical protein [Nocardia sp. NPDC051981]|uniref:hypothetical protein n=1 Tax=Nocardia sp. NPDC051981 TaxID=3155417 RepID=UPI003417D8E5